MTANRILFLANLLIALIVAGEASAAEPQWIWTQKEAQTKAAGGEVAFRKAFNVDGAVDTATITITADNTFDLFLNGRHLGSGDNWMQRVKFDLKPVLVPGRSILAVRATNAANDDPAGLAAMIDIKPAGKEAFQVPTDGSWKFATKLLGNWARVEFDDSKWESAVALGEYGKTGPWGTAGAIVQGVTATTADKAKNAERGLFDFKDGDRLVLLGSAFIERMQSNGYFELELISAFPDKNITVRNLGWSGDNVWGDSRAVFGSRADGFKRLMSDVNLCKPSVILVCYGENEAYAGDAGLDEFERGFNTLLDNLEKTGARLVIATPRKHENVGKPFPDQTKYNADLRKYCDVMKETAKARELTFVDWLDVASKERLTQNGVHLTPYGSWLAAFDMAASFGAISSDWQVSLDLKEKIMDATGTTLTNVSIKPDHVAFEMQSRRHPPAILGKEDESSAPWFEPLPPPQENANGSITYSGSISQIALPLPKYRGLRPGNYQLFVNGQESTNPASAQEWSDGITESLPGQTEQIEKLRKAINEKNFLFFNRYRPQNETYLFLFRKHEQGNNAVEIPQFDPLIEEQEKIIADLKKPPKQKFELRRVSDAK